MKKRVLIAVLAIAALGAGGAAIAGAASGGDDDGGDKVTETEVGDEESYYEVEVRQPDGSQVDVQLDRGFNVVGNTADHEDGR
jgi:hypothetical protein